MTPSTDVRAGDVIRISGTLFKVQEINLHAGGGKSGSMVHAKLRQLGTGQLSEQRFATTDKLDKLEVERVPMEYLYHEGDEMVFMHPTSFEQCRLPKQAVGDAAVFIKEGTTISVELLDEKPIALDLPESAELTVKSTGTGAKGDTAFKEAELENGITVKVPPFIKEGDTVRISIETREYMDRVHDKQEKAVFKGAAKKGPSGKPASPAPGAASPTAPATPPPAAEKKEKK